MIAIIITLTIMNKYKLSIALALLTAVFSGVNNFLIICVMPFPEK